MLRPVPSAKIAYGTAANLPPIATNHETLKPTEKLHLHRKLCPALQITASGKLIA